MEDNPFDLEALKALYKAKGRILDQLLLITADNQILDLESEEGQKELRQIFAKGARHNRDKTKSCLVPEE